MLQASGLALTFPFLAAAQVDNPIGKSKLVLLGTAGGPTPKPNRAAPANAVIIGDKIYLVDCGNGVARQMVLAGLKLGDLDSLFITHHHSDHNADYGNVLLLAWASTLTSAVHCYGPPPLEQMTRDFLALNRSDIDIRVADEGRPLLDTLIRAKERVSAGLVHQDDRVTVSCALVDHPPVTPSFAYRFDCPDRSIVFSGDCRPSPALVQLAKGADVLVHEVMHLPSIDALIATEPNAKTLRDHLIASHTTTQQVGKIAAAAGVKKLVLSHFVPGGYPFVSDAQWREDVVRDFDGEIIVGEDLMVL